MIQGNNNGRVLEKGDIHVRDSSSSSPPPPDPEREGGRSSLIRMLYEESEMSVSSSGKMEPRTSRSSCCSSKWDMLPFSNFVGMERFEGRMGEREMQR